MRLISAGSLVRAQSGPFQVPAETGAHYDEPLISNRSESKIAMHRQNTPFWRLARVRQLRPDLSPSQTETVFFDICILGRKYNFGESEVEE